MTLMKPREIAQILRVSLPTVNKLIRENKLRAIAVGDSHRIDSADLQKYLTANLNSDSTSSDTSSAE